MQTDLEDRRRKASRLDSRLHQEVRPSIRRGYRAPAPQAGPSENGVPIVRYFKNQRGLFYGEQAKYFNPRSSDPLDGVNFWSDCERHVPECRIPRTRCRQSPHALRGSFRAWGISRSFAAAFIARSTTQCTRFWKGWFSLLGTSSICRRRSLPAIGHLRDYGMDSLSGMLLLNRINPFFLKSTATLPLIMKATIRDVADAICPKSFRKIKHKSAPDGSEHLAGSSSRTRRLDTAPVNPNALSVPFGSEVCASSTDGLNSADGALRRLIGEWHRRTWTRRAANCTSNSSKGAMTCNPCAIVVGNFELLRRILKEGEKYFPASFARRSCYAGPEVGPSNQPQIFFRRGSGSRYTSLSLLNKAFNDTVQRQLNFQNRCTGRQPLDAGDSG